MDPSVNELPSVVVVVVTGDPGPELERTLASVVAQDLPCSLLVIDDASAVDPTPRVAAVAPRAFVKRLSRVSGYAAAANQVIGMVEGAGFYLLCHDDIDLAPTAVRAMVDEAIRSDAGIVTPKLVASEDHERLLAVGLATDRTARAVAMVERRELDQHQHDQVRDVAAASGACLLVGADLFAALRGFDESTTKPPARAVVGEDSRHHLLGRALAAPELGEDVDLCWRARLRGVRIVVAPGASVAHSERSHRMPPALPGSMSEEHTRSRQLALNTASSARLLAARRNRVRTVSSVHGARRLVPALIGLIVQWLLMIRQSRGQFVRLVRVIPRAGIGSLLRHRRVVQRTRSVPDAQLDRLHLGVLHRWRRTFSADLAEDGAQAWTLAERTLLAGVRRGPGRWVATAAAVFTGVFVLGSRHLIGQGVPVVGQLVPFAPLDELLRAYGSGWRLVGTGSSAAGPPALAVLALARIATFGADGLARTLLSVGMIPVGVLGAWRLARRLTQSDAGAAVPGAAVRLRALAGIAGAVAYGACPLPYGALRLGRWDALLVYGACPWLLGRLTASTGWAPFDRTRSHNRRLPAVGLRLLQGAVPVALLTAFVPSAPFVVAIMVVGLALGALLIGEVAGLRGPFTWAVGGILGSFVLLFPWSIDVVRDRASLLGGGPVGGGDHAELLDLIRFHTAAGSAGWLAAALPIAAFVPLVLVAEDRLRWTCRLWAVALVAISVAWAGERGWIGNVALSTEVVLVPAALALALAAALGAAGIVTDLRLQRFGWRQVLVGVGAAALSVGALPTVWAARDGRWGMPHRDHRSALAWMDDQLADGGFRIVWLGASRAIPGGGWPLEGRQGDGQLAWSMSTDAQPDVRTSWPGSVGGPARRVADDLRVARDAGTFRLGSRLAPLAVRYVVLVERAAPDRAGTSPLPAAARRLLDAQLDLRQLDVSGGLRVYENTKWVPRRTLSAGGRVSAVLGGAPDGVRISGSLLQAGTLRVADTPSSRWTLDTSLGRAQRSEDESSMTFAAGVGGPVQLDYHPPLLLRTALVVQAALWVLTAGAALNEWRSRRRHLGELLALLPPEDSRDAFEGAFSVERAFADDDAISLSPPPVRHRAPAHDPVPGGRAIRLRPRLRSVPSHRDGGAAVPAAIDAESAPGAGPDDQVEGTLADEMWSRWTTRQGLRNHPERTRASDSRRSHDVIAGPGATGDPGDQDRAGPPGTPERKR